MKRFTILMAAALVGATAHAAGSTTTTTTTSSSTTTTTSASATTPPAPLTRDQLRACMARQDGMAAAQATFAGRTEALNQEEARLVSEDQDIRTIQSRLNPGSPQELVDNYNQIVHNHNLRRGAHIAAANALNADIGRYESDRAAFDADCANRQVGQADQDAVLRERAAASAAGR